MDAQQDPGPSPAAASATPAPAAATKPDALTLLVFAAFVVFAAGNVVGVRYMANALPPFWGAGTRLLAASALFFAYMAARKVPLPRGRDLRGAVIFGVMQFGVGLALGYWGLQKVSAGLGSVVLAAVPLLTMLAAASTRIERLTVRGIIGALLAIAGVVVISGGVGGAVPFAYFAAVLGTAVAFAVSVVILKLFQGAHPAAINAVGTLVGGGILIVLSLVFGEHAGLPQGTAPWLAWAYLVLFGSVGLFGALQFVVRRWTASATSYQAVLSPVVAIALGAWLLREPVSSRLLLGGVFIVAGVWVGALMHRRERVCAAEAAAPCV